MLSSGVSTQAKPVEASRVADLHNSPGSFNLASASQAQKPPSMDYAKITVTSADLKKTLSSSQELGQRLANKFSGNRG